MIGVIKAIKHVQVKNIAYHPHLYQAIITYEVYPRSLRLFNGIEHDESDDLEYQKDLMNKLIGDKWFLKVP